MQPKNSITNGPATIVGVIFNRSGSTVLGWALPGGEFTTSKVRADYAAKCIRKAIMGSR